jgi:DNA-binding GntR family transcriptional regulator
VLAPGEAIRDSEVARQLGVSRTPVREALQLLESAGLVVTVPGRFTRVAHVDLSQANHLLPMLAVLHALATESAVPRVIEADIASMRAANDRLLASAVTGNAAATRRADHDFHKVLVTRAANPFLSNAIDAVEMHARRVDAVYFAEEGPSKTSGAEHARIIEAVERRDASEAARLVRLNYERSWRNLIERSASSPASP